jgi:rhodanese-related sulfurtransferase
MAPGDIKEQLYPQVARVAQALASDKRLEVLDILSQSPRHVDSLAQETGMSVANASQHLQVLRAARLVESERDGNRTVYRLAGSEVANLWLALRGVAESRLAEVQLLAQEFHSSRSNGNLVTRGVAALLTRQNVVLLDVRPAMEFESGHLRGAINIPLDDLPERMHELPQDRRIIAYCRGLYCLLADEAAAFLLDNGFDVVRLEGGWPEWQSEGRPITGGVR